MRTQIKYKGFYITVCLSKKHQELIGTLYSKTYKPDYYYYTYRFHGYIEQQLIDKMKMEVDDFLWKHKQYLEKQIEQTKKSLDYLNTGLMNIGE